jgi:hypothetical protein
VLWSGRSERVAALAAMAKHHQVAIREFRTDQLPWEGLSMITLKASSLEVF